MKIEVLKPQDNAALAALIRDNLEKHDLAVPGTVYFDEGLDHLSDYYLGHEGRTYLVLRDEDDRLVGGVGLAEFAPFEACAELQKLYLADEVKGQGLSYLMIWRIEEAAWKLGYRHMYLETHTNLQTAMHVYEKCGYRLIDRPAAVVHSTMNRFYLKELRKTIHVVAALIREEDRVFATQRGYGAFKDGWEFPGGKIEPGETPREALVREIHEELDSTIEAGELFDTIDYDYPDFHLHMDCFWCTLTEGDLELKEAEAARWLTADTIDDVNWLPADRSLVQKIKHELKKER